MSQPLVRSLSFNLVPRHPLSQCLRGNRGIQLAAPPRPWDPQQGPVDVAQDEQLSVQHTCSQQLAIKRLSAPC